MRKTIYPKLTLHADLGFIRAGGAGLANCMIISGRAYAIAKKEGSDFINPTWGKISIGPYIRKEIDKRHYFGLFKPFGISGIKKMYYLFLFLLKNKNIIKIDDLGNYFRELRESYSTVKEYFDKIINKKRLRGLAGLDFTDVIGVHVRLGDYKNTKLETNISYYKNLILKIEEMYQDKYQFYVFSDAQDEEIKELLSIKNVKKVFFGNALADLIALSKTRLIIGSDSTFSGLASFLNQTPIIFSTRHFDAVLNDPNKEFVISSNNNSDESLHNFLSNVI